MLGKTLKLAAAGNTGAAEAVNVEDVFSTFTYTGNDTTQAITNGIDLAGEGGMTWIYVRNNAAENIIFDTERGTTKSLSTSTDDAEYTATGGTEGLSSFNSDGFTAKLYQDSTGINNSANDLVSWTFRKQPGFFDIVTYTGDGSSSLSISHNLGSTPGWIIVKNRTFGASWVYWHFGLTNNQYRRFKQESVQTGAVFPSNPTATTFTVGNVGSFANISGHSYIAYLFANDDQRFGPDGNESIIKTGIYTGNGSSQTVNLGWEPQWIFLAPKTTSSALIALDTVRGLPVKNATGTNYTQLNLAYVYGTYVEFTSTDSPPYFSPLPDGFGVNTANFYNDSGVEYFYVAIRKGLMGTPTDATKIFAAANASGSDPAFTAGFPPDTAFFKARGSTGSVYFLARHHNRTALASTTTNGVSGFTSIGLWDYMNGFFEGSPTGTTPWSAMFRQARGFMDIAYYDGTGASNQSVPHNLKVKPGLVITKRLDSIDDWTVYTDVGGSMQKLALNSTAAATSSTASTPTASAFNPADSNTNGGRYLAYLFGSVDGVSKVGTYAGVFTSAVQVDCGFTSGARFILLRRLDNAGNWFLFDYVSGITAGNDSYIRPNVTDAAVTGNDDIDPYSPGFEAVSNSFTSNTSGNTYIYLAIA